MFATPHLFDLKLDLDVYADAGKAVSRGESPYVDYFIYPPPVAYLFSILIKLGEIPFKILFSAITILSLYYTYTMVGGGKKMMVFIGIGAAVLNIAAIINFLIIKAFKNKNHFMSSLALSTASIIKIYPAMFIPIHYKKHNFNPRCIAGYAIPLVITGMTLTQNNIAGFISSVVKTHSELLGWIVLSVPTYIKYYLGMDFFGAFTVLFLMMYALTTYLVLSSRLTWVQGFGVISILYAILFPFAEYTHIQFLLVPFMFGLAGFGRVKSFAMIHALGAILFLAMLYWYKGLAIQIGHLFNAASLVVLLIILNQAVHPFYARYYTALSYAKEKIRNRIKKYDI